jgi:ribonuclease R
VLNHARLERGTIDFETTETKILFGEDRKIAAIEPSVRNDAHKIIEECMILANVCAARFLKEHDIPALHRVHAPPSAEKLEDLRAFLAGVGLSLGGGMEPEPADYARVLQQVQGRADFHLIQTVLLRSQSQAQYSPDTETGHFGLAHEDYAHFTSPIRRYPDLLVHRGIRHVLEGGTAANFMYSHADMQALGEHCSMAERRADDASRDVTAWLKCEYMQEHVGEVFDGIITAVTNFGLFVELSDIYIEGLVHVTALTNDYYRYDPVRHRLTGESSGRTFRLADSIRVKVVRVDLDERKIDFVLAEGAEKSEKRSSRTAKTSKSAKANTSAKATTASKSRKTTKATTASKSAKTTKATTASKSAKPTKKPAARKKKT